MKHSHKDFIHQSFAKHFRRNSFGEIWNLSEKFSQQTNRCLKQGECRFGSITMGISVMLGHLKACFRRLLFGLWFLSGKTSYWTFRRATMSRLDASYCIVQKTFSARLFVSMAQHWWIWHMQNTHLKPHLCPLSVPRHQSRCQRGPNCGIIPNVLIK